MFVKLRAIYLPLVGLVSMVDILERLAGETGGKTAAADRLDDITTREGIREWNEIMQSLHDPFENLINGMSDGLHHVTYRLKFEKMPKHKQEDTEADLTITRPGEPGFASHLHEKCNRFWGKRAEALKIWCKQKRIPLIDHNSENPETYKVHLTRIFSRDHARQQLYMILYMEYLLHATADAVCDLAKEADILIENGTMKRRRLLVPGKRRLLKWLRAAFKIEDSSDENAVDSFEETMYTLSLGDAFKKRKNPEHLLPASESIISLQTLIRILNSP